MELRDYQRRDEHWVGEAGEHFVCFDILRSGYDAWLASYRLAYDVVIDVKSRLIRVQVKSTTHKHLINSPDWPGYRFHSRSCRRQRKRKEYYLSEFDVLALVAIDVNRVAYIANCDAQRSYVFREDQRAGIRKCHKFEDYPLDAALKRIGVNI